MAMMVPDTIDYFTPCTCVQDNYTHRNCCLYCSLLGNQIGDAGAKTIAEGYKLCHNLQRIE